MVAGDTKLPGAQDARRWHFIATVLKGSSALKKTPSPPSGLANEPKPEAGELSAYKRTPSIATSSAKDHFPPFCGDGMCNLVNDNVLYHERDSC